MNYSDQIFTNLYTFTVLIILLICIHKEVQETLLLTQDFPNSLRLSLQCMFCLVHDVLKNHNKKEVQYCTCSYL